MSVWVKKREERKKEQDNIHTHIHTLTHSAKRYHNIVPFPILMNSGLVVLLPLLFLIGVLAVILISAINLLADAFPVVALAVAVFCLILLGVLIAAVLKKDNE